MRFGVQNLSVGGGGGGAASRAIPAVYSVNCVLFLRDFEIGVQILLLDEKGDKKNFN